MDVPCKGRLRDGTPCHEIYHADESHVGGSLRCPVCGAINRIEHAGALPTRPAKVRQVDTRAARHVARSGLRGGRWKRATIIGVSLLAVFAIALIAVQQRPKPHIEAGSDRALPATDEPAEGDRVFSNTAPAIQPPNPLANSPQHSLNPFENAGSPSKDGSAQATVVPPCAQGQAVQRLPTGARIEPDGEASGPSELNVSNGTTRDAAVGLVNVDSGNTARFVYIEAGHEYTLKGIEPGTYALRFASGKDWAPACHDFLQSDYSEFESALVFKDVMVHSGRENYNTIHVTLNPVPLGTARTRTIDRKRFLEGDRLIVTEPGTANAQ